MKNFFFANNFSLFFLAKICTWKLFCMINTHSKMMQSSFIGVHECMLNYNWRKRISKDISCWVQSMHLFCHWNFKCHQTLNVNSCYSDSLSGLPDLNFRLLLRFKITAGRFSRNASGCDCNWSHFMWLLKILHMKNFCNNFDRLADF